MLLKNRYKKKSNKYKKTVSPTNSIPTDSMNTTSTRQTHLTIINNKRTNTIPTAIQHCPNKQFNRPQHPVPNIKNNNIVIVDTRSNNSTSILSNDTSHRHTALLNTRRGRLKQN